MNNTIKIHKSDVEIFCEVIANLQKNGLAYHSNLVGDDFVITVTGH
jgi:hypothetical protein